MSVNIRSIRYTFQKVDNKYEMKDAVPSVSVAPPTDTTDALENVTGTWAELLDGSGNVIYRKFFYDMVYSTPEDEFRVRDQFDLFLPCLSDAKTVRLFAPPPRDNGIRGYWGDESEVIGEYPVPTHFLQSEWTEPKLPCDICGEGRGQVVKKTLLKDSGNKHAYNLVILADKFKDSKSLEKYVKGAQKCVNFLFSHPPFDTIMGYNSFNVWCVEIETYDANQPYFYVSYNDTGSTRVEWKHEYVKKVCDALFESAGWSHVCIIIKEDDIYLGTGWSSDHQFAISLFKDKSYGNTPEATFQHEFGHAVFSLKDEYGGKGPYTGNEPAEINVTTVTQRNLLKWRNFVEDATPIPTPESFYKNNPDKVGCYEGGATYDTGIYRPQFVCAMRTHWDKKTYGHYCKVCLAQARHTLASTFKFSIPVPGILYYSRSKRSWENIRIASNMDERYVPPQKNYEYFQDLLNELTKGGEVGDKVKDLLKIYGVNITQGTIIPAGDEVMEGMRIWFVNNYSEYLYYIITYESQLQTTLICAGHIKIPMFSNMTMFDGISLGLEQHVFCLTDGELQRGIMSATGEIGDFVKQNVRGLTQDLEGISVSYKDGGAAIYVAVMSEYKVKLGTYQLAASTWEPHGFIDMPEDDGSAYEFVKIMNVKNNVYVLAKNASGIVIRIFDPVNMVWREGKKMTAAIAGTESVLQADWAYYQNKAYLTYIYDDNKIASVSVELTGNSVQVTDCPIMPGSSSFQGIITSFGTTVCDNDLHVIYTLDRKAMHSIFRFKFDYKTNKYGLEFSETLQITSPGFEKYAVQSLSTHNNDSVIYLILSCDEELTLPETK